MPQMLYAIGVLQVEVDGKGQVTALHWMRAPTHAPEVVAEIERTVRLAAPFPVPVRMGRVTYTDTWLWHSSGRFQLDTLTEGLVFQDTTLDVYLTGEQNLRFHAELYGIQAAAYR